MVPLHVLRYCLLVWERVEGGRKEKKEVVEEEEEEGGGEEN